MAVLLFCAFSPTLPAQLSITEVMTSGSTNGLEPTFQRPDFWELTNFGTNTINLEGYTWFDKDDTYRQSFPATDINPRESIVFFKETTVVQNEYVFREWWGLPAGIRVYSWWNAPGFDADDGDAVRIWDPSGNLVDEARFESAQMGVTFTYNTNSGAFTEFSQEGVAGAFRAAIGEDIGSPGSASNGPVALRITQQPISQTVAPGSEVVLKVRATGRPSPQYQWSFNSVPIPEPSTSTIPRLVCFVNCGPSWRRDTPRGDLLLSAIEHDESGDYSVEVFNGLESLVSAVQVSVSTNSSPVRVECPPEEPCVPCAGMDLIANLVASPGQSAIFTVRNQGYPLPTFQWSRSVGGGAFIDLPGETGRDLVMSSVQDSHAGLYRVRLNNSLGTTSAVARLTVKATPRLEITEVMSQACSELDLDWWELTNMGAEPVNLCGYRWDDETTRHPTSHELGIGGGPTITNDITLQPGESAILLESQSPESFVQWWGASNLPPNLRFVTYTANGLGVEKDFIYLWDPNETEASRYVARAEFGKAIPERTRWFDSFIALQNGCGDPSSGTASNQGDCGAFKAERGCEIGSPGWTRLTPPTLTSVRREGPSVALSWRAQPGSTNRVQFARRLAAPLSATLWEDLPGEFQFPSATCVATDASIGTDSQRFYRVVRVAAANCPCL